MISSNNNHSNIAEKRHQQQNSSFDPSNLSDLPCVERKVFIAFKDQLYLKIKMPKEVGNDQIHMITAPGSQFFCSTAKGLILRSDAAENNTIETIIVPTSEDFANDKTKVKFLLAGYYHVIAIKESNKIYVHVLSENSQYGKLEKPTTSGVEPFSLVATKHIIMDGQRITHAVCGTYSTIVVLDNRYIYIAGRVEQQLTDFTPFTVGTGYPIIRNITAGYGHMIVQTVNGDIYVMGMNNYGQTLSVTSSNVLEKLPSIPGVVNINALRLSHLTCYTTNNLFMINGYVGHDNIGGFETVKSYQFSKHVDYAHDLRMFGGFTSIVSFNPRTRELMSCGSATNAPNTPYNIMEKLKVQYAENVELANYIDSHTVIDVACGSSLIAVMMDVIRNNTLLINNLLKMKRYATHELTHSSETVPFHDVLIIHD
ncbi:hypothetical protein NAEGRDRAFT_79416 [Naegleria gruberi]|uniref:Uncharacterized protein n=1 Tax=Naegleria gruberi TaxID=5762 RepID=D2VCC3_NAEGR|nr:uncharacterized protein NAEGRDRAFT_79416 [Naegleria gruberi]EFC45727.1 hypothetical protein NAEGRDRAFT_79416 [Naegleria gruberi]|eukprot:XP_002678471.1 hypothetical protein NAEGRDRAFT_79416 [Naegleria gruberi strain NEG-M]